MNLTDQQRKGYFLAFSAAFIWSGFIIVSRYGGISGLTAFDVIAIRYITCASLLLPVFVIWRPFNLFRPHLIVSALVGGLAYALFAFIGFSGAPASHAAVLLPGLLPMFIYLISITTKQDRPSKTKSFGTAVITLGIAVLIGDLFSQGATANFSHLSLALSALCWSIYSVFIRLWKISPWEATASLAFWTLLFYLPIYLMLLPSQITEVSWNIIATQAFYQGFLATIVQMLCYVKAVQLIGAANMGSIMGFVPLIAGFAAIPIFNEPLSTSLASALILVSAGVWLSNQTKEKKLCPTSTSRLPTKL